MELAGPTKNVWILSISADMLKLLLDLDANVATVNAAGKTLLSWLLKKKNTTLKTKEKL